MKDKIMNILMQVNPNLATYEGTDFIESGMIESMEIMDIIVNLEEEFGIEIQPEDIVPEYFKSVTTLMELVEKNQ